MVIHRSRLPLADFYCYAQLPRTGLGNMLLVWARAAAFAHVNHLALLPSTWTKLHVGPLLRGERDLRFYTRTFKRPDPLTTGKIQLVLRTYHKVLDPPVAPMSAPAPERTHSVYVFQKLPHWSDYFATLRDHREYIRDAVYSLLLPRRRQAIVSAPGPVVGVHIRLGDFLPAGPKGRLPHAEGIRTPLDYFIDLIEGIRDVAGRELPVTVFSDGEDGELEPILRISNVRRAPENPAIVDLLILSRSKLVITSAGSTFSAWSAFLADAPAIHHPDHPDHVHARSRPDCVNNTFFEGSAEGSPRTWPELLLKNIRDIC